MSINDVKLTSEQKDKLVYLLSYSNRYQLSFQFWPVLTAVYIEKDDVPLKDFGGDFDYTINSAIEYLDRINGKEDLTGLYELAKKSTLK